MSKGHPARAESGKMKVRDLATGVVLERDPAGASERVANGSDEWVDAESVPSARETLEAMPWDGLSALAASAGFRIAQATISKDHAVGQLLPLIERGELSLDMAGMDDMEDADDSPTPEG